MTTGGSDWIAAATLTLFFVISDSASRELLVIVSSSTTIFVYLVARETSWSDEGDVDIYLPRQTLIEDLNHANLV